MILVLNVLLLLSVIFVLIGLAVYRFIQDKKYAKTMFNGSNEYLDL